MPADPYPFGLTWAEPFRAARIAERIEAKPRLTPDDVAAIQLDRVSLQAARAPEPARAARPRRTRLRATLSRGSSRWNGEMAPDSVEAAIYAAWFVELARMPEDELGEVPRGSHARPIPHQRAAARIPPGATMAVRREVETCADVPGGEPRAGARVPARPSRRGSVRLALGAAPPRRFPPRRLPRGALSPSLLRSRDRAGRRRRRPSTWAHSPRTDPSRWTKAPATARSSTSPVPCAAATCITTGQSGNVFSRRYRDFLPDWRAGRYIEIEGQPAVDVLVLGP